jgi:hypothetical protein
MILYTAGFICPPIVLLYLATTKKPVPSFVRKACIVMLVAFFIWLTYFAYFR